MAKTNTGLDEKIAAMLAYIITWPSGIIMLILEPDNKFVRFHAIQSIIVFGVLSLVVAILGWIPVFGWFVRIVLGVLAFILWVILLVKASQGEKYKVRIAGDYAEKLTGPAAE